MNEHFVCIKVDREERPDVDAIYMEAVQAMTGHGGWPLNAFLTPDGVPFYAGTYFPARAAPGDAVVAAGADRRGHAFREQRSEVDDSGDARSCARLRRAPPRCRRPRARSTAPVLDEALAATPPRTTTRSSAAGAARRSSPPRR